MRITPSDMIEFRKVFSGSNVRFRLTSIDETEGTVVLQTLTRAGVCRQVSVTALDGVVPGTLVSVSCQTGDITTVQEGG